MRKSIVNSVEIPEDKTYMRAQYIHRGYFIATSYRSGLRGLFQWHNQTLNAWTMILDVILTLGCYMLYLPHIGLDRAPLLVLAAMILHLPFSVGCHMFHSISERHYRLWMRLDVTFIFVAATVYSYCTSL